MFFEDAKVRETLLFTMPNAPQETSKKHEIRQGIKNDLLNLVRCPLGVGVVFGSENDIIWGPSGGPKAISESKKLNC